MTHYHRKSTYAVIDPQRADFEEQRAYDILENALLLLDSKLYFDHEDSLTIETRSGRRFFIQRL